MGHLHVAEKTAKDAQERAATLEADFAAATKALEAARADGAALTAKCDELAANVAQLQQQMAQVDVAGVRAELAKATERATAAETRAIDLETSAAKVAQERDDLDAACKRLEQLLAEANQARQRERMAIDPMPVSVPSRSGSDTDAADEDRELMVVLNAATLEAQQVWPAACTVQLVGVAQSLRACCCLRVSPHFHPQAASEELRQVKAELEALKAEKAQVQEKLAAEASARHAAEAEAATLRAQVQALDSARVAASTMDSELRDKLETAQAEAAEARAAYEREQREHDATKSQLQSTRADMQALQQRTSEDAEAAAKRISELTATINTIESERATLEADVAEAARAQTNHVATVKELRERLKRADAEASALRVEVARMHDLAGNADALARERDSWKDRCTTAEAELADRDTQLVQYSAVCQALFDAQKFFLQSILNMDSTLRRLPMVTWPATEVQRRPLEDALLLEYSQDGAARAAELWRTTATAFVQQAEAALSQAALAFEVTDAAPPRYAAVSDFRAGDVVVFFKAKDSPDWVAFHAWQDLRLRAHPDSLARARTSNHLRQDSVWIFGTIVWIEQDEAEPNIQRALFEPIKQGP